MKEFLIQLGRLALDVGPLLVFGLAVAGVLHVLVTEQAVLRHLGRRGWASVLRATAFGVPLPLCSCSVVPVAASLRRKGASDGATVGFLISAPQIGADSFLLTQGLMGPLFAVYRVLVSFLTALTAGLLVDQSAKPLPPLPATEAAGRERLRSPVREFLAHVEELVGSLADNLVLGLLLAAAILVFLPSGWLSGGPGAGLWLPMLAMLAVGLPLYVCATASTPIAAALVAKGLHPGAALVFLLAGPATNMVTLVMLKSSLGWRALAIYLGTISAMALGAGALLGWWAPGLGAQVAELCQHHEGAGWLEWTGLGLMGALLLRHYLRVLGRRLRRPGRPAVQADGPLEFRVEGMTCSHCAGRVEQTVNASGLGRALEVDPANGRLVVEPADGVDAAALRAGLACRLDEAGYGLSGDPTTNR